MKKLNKLDIVLSIYNQEKLIERVLYGLFFHTTTAFNLILVFDGCTDNSEKKTRDFIRRFRPKNLKQVIIKHTSNIYETKANNIGFREATQPYIITLQDDMVIRELGWERRLTYPLRYFNDVIGVGSRHAQNIKIMNRQKEVYCDQTARELGNLPRNIFSIRDVINRGPIAFRTDYLKQLHYFDEAFAPCNLDEADLSLKAWLKYGWKVGAFWINYTSPFEFGKTHTNNSTMPVEASNRKNRKTMDDRYHTYFSSETKHTQNIVINENQIDYLSNPSLPSLRDRLISYFACHTLGDLLSFCKYIILTLTGFSAKRLHLKDDTFVT